MPDDGRAGVSAMTDSFLPYGRQTIEDDDIAAVTAALKADMLTTGPLVDAFERAFAEAVGAPHAVVCNSGTAALHMAVKAADLQPGEVCVVPTLTFLATANAARFEGGEVVFCDVDPETGLMTAETLRQALPRAHGRHVRAILAVHLRGDPIALGEIKAMADRLDAVVIEGRLSCGGLDQRKQPGRRLRRERHGLFLLPSGENHLHRRGRGRDHARRRPRGAAASRPQPRYDPRSFDLHPRRRGVQRGRRQSLVV